MELLSGALMVIGKATAVLKDRRTRHATLFKEVVEPIFNETEKIMANYHAIFAKLDTALRSEDEATIRTAAGVFAVDRMEMKAARVKIEAFTVAAREFSTAHSPEEPDGVLRSEMDKFQEFLQSATNVILNKFENDSLSMMAMERVYTYLKGKEKITPATLVEMLKILIGHSESAWKRTCVLYEQLKLSYALGVDEFIPAKESKLRFWQ